MKLTIKMEFVIIIVMFLVSVILQGVICYRQTQIQESLIDTNGAMGSVLLESRQREREYYDIMSVLDMKLKTGEIILKQEDVE